MSEANQVLRWFPARPTRRTVALHVGVVCGLLALSLWLWRDVWFSGHFQNLPRVQIADPAQESWFLAWGPEMLRHGYNPFLSHLMYAGQGGINVLSNTSEYTVSLLFAPVTWLFGPIVTFNLAALLAPVVTGYAMFIALRAMTSLFAAQFIASAIFAFCPPMMSNLPFGHLMAVVLFYPPVVLWCSYELLVRRRYDPRATGMVLGGATIVQFFLGTELLAIVAIATVVGVLCFLLPFPTRQAVPWRHVGIAAATALGLALIVLAYPLWYVFAGPQHVSGPAWPLVTITGDSLGAIVTHKGAGTTATGANFDPQAWVPSGAFMGWLWLVALVASMWRWRKLEWVLFGVGVFSWGASLGVMYNSELPLGGYFLPMRIMTHLPVISAILPARFTATEFFCASVLLALSAQRWFSWATAPQRRGAHRHARRSTALIYGAVAAVMVLAIAPVIAQYPKAIPTHAVKEPRWFPEGGHKIGANEIVLMYPNYSSLLWEAKEQLPFAIAGGYAVVPGRDGKTAASFFPPAPLENYLHVSEITNTARPVTMTAAELNTAGATLRAEGVTRVVVITKGTKAGAVAATFATLFGRPPVIVDGAMEWRRVQLIPIKDATDKDAAALHLCGTLHHKDARWAVSCVLSLDAKVNGG